MEHKARSGEDYIVTLLNEYCASRAILRLWAGHDVAVAQREAEIQRLERPVWMRFTLYKRQASIQNPASFGGRWEEVDLRCYSGAP